MNKSACVGSIQALIVQRIFAMQDRTFDCSFAKVIVDRRVGHAKESGQSFPMPQQISDGLPSSFGRHAPGRIWSTASAINIENVDTKDVSAQSSAGRLDLMLDRD
jgi:hypothetical protein